jgi:shikimate kinase
MASADRTRRVFLIGFMGAGKTTVGRALARRLGWTFQDLDEIIERSQGASVASIFAEAGETGFRRLEHSALEEILAGKRNDPGDNQVVALGGGAYAQADNRQLLERAGATVILLQAPLEELRRRCRQDTRVRPLAQNDAEAGFARLFAERQAAYNLARFRVETMDKAVDDVAAEIEQMLAAAQPEVT